MSIKGTETVKHIEKLTSSRSYRTKNLDSKQSALMKMSVEYSGKKKITLGKLYEDVLGYSENSVICGRCNTKGTLRKKGDYYEVRHVRSEKEVCYLGKDPSDEIIYVPIRIVNRE